METYILQNNNPILHLDTPKRKVALWHITKRCNMECKYCYGTFEGLSYKKNINEKDFDYNTMVSIVDFLSDSGINRIHLCGGEPFLYKDFHKLLKYISSKKIESFVLSNFTFLPSYTEELFAESIISNISFSLDSIDKDYNIFMRGAHEKVINNINKIINYKQVYNSNIELGMYVVATKKNIDLLIPLIDWAVEKGINYITLQAVYLPKNHRYYNELSLENSDIILIENIFEYLTKFNNKIRISGSLLKYITRLLIDKDNLQVQNCFVENDEQYFFIDGNGNIKTCTTKSNIVGKIEKGELCILKHNNCKKICSDFCLDCIGIWEMVYPEDVNNFINII